MSGIVERAPVPHVCRPGWEEGAGGSLMRVRGRIGDVWGCDCGRRFVAYDDPQNHAMIGQQTCGSVVWKPERLRKRRWWNRRGR